MHVHALDSIAADILEEIFLTSVHWYRTRIPPLILAAVCRRWRDVALQSGRLWTDINVLKPEARFLVQHSQRADLDVVWCEHTMIQRRRLPDFDRLNMVDGMPWLYSQLDRFRVLAVHTSIFWRHPDDILPILSLPTATLPRLKALVLAYTDEDGNTSSWQPRLKLGMKMPSLCHITLWNQKICVNDLMALFVNCRLLESTVLAALELAVDCESPPSDSQVDDVVTDASESAAHDLQNMREFILIRPNLNLQHLVLKTLRFPKDCTLTMADYRGCDWESVGGSQGEILMMPLHPLLVSTFHPVFTHCAFDGDIIELTEDDSPSTTRCRLRVSLVVTLEPWRQDASGTASALLSKVHTLTLVRCERKNWTMDVWGFFDRYCPNLSTLILHGYHHSDDSTIIPALLLPALREIHYLAPPYCRAWMPVRHDEISSEKHILTQLRARKNDGGSRRPSSVSRLVLYEHGRPLDEKILSDLRSEVSVEIRGRDEYFCEVERTQSIREREHSSWWPTCRPSPFRAWLSSAAADCSACNGYLEMHARTETSDEEEDFECYWSYIVD